LRGGLARSESRLLHLTGMRIPVVLQTNEWGLAMGHDLLTA